MATFSCGIAASRSACATGAGSVVARTGGTCVIDNDNTARRQHASRVMARQVSLRGIANRSPCRLDYSDRCREFASLEPWASLFPPIREVGREEKTDGLVTAIDPA